MSCVDILLFWELYQDCGKAPLSWKARRCHMLPLRPPRRCPRPTAAAACCSAGSCLAACGCESPLPSSSSSSVFFSIVKLRSLKPSSSSSPPLPPPPRHHRGRRPCRRRRRRRCGDAQIRDEGRRETSRRQASLSSRVSRSARAAAAPAASAQAPDPPLSPRRILRRGRGIGEGDGREGRRGRRKETGTGGGSGGERVVVVGELLRGRVGEDEGVGGQRRGLREHPPGESGEVLAWKGSARPPRAAARPRTTRRSSCRRAGPRRSPGTVVGGADLRLRQGWRCSSPWRSRSRPASPPAAAVLLLPLPPPPPRRGALAHDAGGRRSGP